MNVPKGHDVSFVVPFARATLQKPDVRWIFNGKEISESDKVSEGATNESILVGTFYIFWSHVRRQNEVFRSLI